MRTLTFTDAAWSDYLYWQSEDQNTLKRINRLIDAARIDQIAGLGKPEALKEYLSGLWSRRIDAKHRLVYEVQQAELIILACRYHH